MICIIRIRGRVGLDRDIKETFDRLRLRKKYSCIVIKRPSKEELGMIKKLRNFIAYGTISEYTYKKLVSKRKTKIENFFRLHPPRKGINTKSHFPKGVLGDHKEKINELVERML
jgi:large subunit ribosomal protein L30